ncbi:MAG: HEAT repeat domain-containing protein [Deltaproteobacteria bacterium]|nr:HEAT repeat domain-containing protein [Deltaproteobacteria bacterium]
MFELLLMFHLIVSLILFFLIPKNLVLFFFFFPGIGAIGLAVLYFFTKQRIPPEKIMEPEEDWLTLTELPKPKPMISKSRTERMIEELDLMSLAEILSSSDLELKRGALEKLALLRTPEAIDLLLRHRSDPSAEVRFYVTSALEKIKRDFDEELEVTRNQMEKKQTGAMVNLSLSKIYLQYIQSGLLDEATARVFEREAFYHLNQAVATGTGDPQAYRTLIQLYRKQSAWDRALELLNQLKQTGKTTESEISKEKAQIFYEAGRYAEMVQEFNRLKEKGAADPSWTALVNWWTS